MATTTASQVLSAPYPVSVTVDAGLENHDRLTTFFRPVLAIPHLILVGPASAVHRFGAAGFLGAAAYVLAIVNWATIVLALKEHPEIRRFQRYYLRWRTRSLAYVGLFVDAYPPFGDAPYPATIEFGEPAQPRDRLTVAFRPILAIPHLVVLAFLLLAWAVATVIAWVAILFTRRYPASLQPFSLGVMRWLLRVEAYALLLVDEYPPFSLE